MRRKIWNPIKDALHSIFSYIYVEEGYYSRSTKVRRYTDLDITKEFEARSKKFEELKRKKVEELYEIEDGGLLEGDAYDKETFLATREQEMNLINQNDRDLTKNIILRGIKRHSVIGVLNNYRQVETLWHDYNLHPFTKEMMDELYHNVIYNLPVSKESLFKIVPELFRSEINKLDYEDRKQFFKPKWTWEMADGTYLGEGITGPEPMIEDTPQMQLINKMMHMNQYYFDQIKDFLQFYAPYFEKEVDAKGYKDLTYYFFQLEVMNVELRTPVERRIMMELEELKEIKEDIEALNRKVWIMETPCELPFEFENKEFAAQCIKMMKYINKYEVMDIEDTILLPPKPLDELSYMERMERDERFDIKELLEESANEFKEMSNKRIPYSERNPTEKDQKFIDQINIAAAGLRPITRLENHTPLSEGINRAELERDPLKEQLPRDKRILVEELYKVYYLNNMDPYKYDVKFWCNYFDLEGEMFRNIVNYMGFPIGSEETAGQIAAVLFFIDTEQKIKRRLITDIKQVEVIEEIERKKIAQLEDGKSKLFLEDYDRIKRQFDEEKVMQEIDEEIKSLQTEYNKVSSAEELMHQEILNRQKELESDNI